jgi:hypothetical protein
MFGWPQLRNAYPDASTAHARRERCLASSRRIGLIVRHVDETNLSATFAHADHNVFVLQFAAMAALLSANVGFIYFHDPGELRRIGYCDLIRRRGTSRHLAIACFPET